MTDASAGDHPTQRFFGISDDGRPHRFDEPLQAADRVEIIAYDTKGRKIGTLHVTGDVRINEPIEVAPDGIRWDLSLHLSGYGLNFPGVTR